MHAFAVVNLVVAASVAAAAPQGYRAPGGFQTSSGIPDFTGSNHIIQVPELESCGDGLYRNIDGKCVEPVVTRNLFLYNAPAYKAPYVAPAQVPDPKIHYNYVFVRSPDIVLGPNPVVVPPPQQKTLVYLLRKRVEGLQQELIELPANPEKPEVYFISYGDGDNLDLPGGIDLQTALSQAPGVGQLIDSSHGQGGADFEQGALIQDGGLEGSHDQGVGFGGPGPLSGGFGGKEEGIGVQVSQIGPSAGGSQNEIIFPDAQLGGQGSGAKIPGKVGGGGGGFTGSVTGGGFSGGVVSGFGSSFVRGGSRGGYGRSKGTISKGLGGQIFPGQSGGFGVIGQVGQGSGPVTGGGNAVGPGLVGGHGPAIGQGGAGGLDQSIGLGSGPAGGHGPALGPGPAGGHGPGPVGGPGPALGPGPGVGPGLAGGPGPALGPGPAGIHGPGPAGGQGPALGPGPAGGHGPALGPGPEGPGPVGGPGIAVGPTVRAGAAGGGLSGAYSEQEATVVRPEATVTGPVVPVYSKVDFDRVFSKVTDSKDE